MNPIPIPGRFAVGANRKRRDQKPRVLFSCTSCRERKLKCNRRAPCDNCERRGLGDDCQYDTTKRPMQRPDHNNSHDNCKARFQNLENRLVQLEDTIRNQQISQPYSTIPGSNTIQVTETNLVDMHEPDVMLSDSAGSRSFNQNHWRAIMNSATREIYGSASDDETSQAECAQMPVLLRGTPRGASIEDLLRALPPRDIADALALRYLDSDEPSLRTFSAFNFLRSSQVTSPFSDASKVIIHVPTFKKEYNEFWADQSKVSRAWLALLFGVLSCAVWIEHSMNPETAELEPPQILTYYKEQCCIALTSSNYTIPGRYKVEAATIYLGVEYLSTDGLKPGVSILVGIVSRLAIMMGYHREPRLYPRLSAFDGEMRRRLWLVLCIIDYFVAWQSGLPTVIAQGISDTASPQVLLDQHFDPNTDLLPRRLSDTNSATMSSNIVYMIAQEGLMSTANAITESSEAYPVPQRTIQLEQQLEAAWTQVPAHLKQPVPPDTSPDTMIRVLTLEMTYQRARCILHRRYLIECRDEPTYKLFRIECVHAAQRILHCQIELFQGILSQPQCQHKIWFGISRAICDCLTAAMVISLEILSRAKHNALIGHGSTVELIQTLQASVTSWKNCPRPSLETAKAVSIIERMLGLIRVSDSTVDPRVETSNTSQIENAQDGFRGSRDQGSPIESLACNASQVTASQEPFSTLSAFDILDFSIWDQEMEYLSQMSMEIDGSRKITS